MKKPTVFIVEDDLVSAQYLKEVLELEGFLVAGIADEGQSAIAQIGKSSVDVVLMDIILKGVMTGSEAALILKKRYPECKIIFLTAYADEEMIEYARDANALAYLMKPYREKEIVATLRMVLQKKIAKSIDKINIPLEHGFSYNIKYQYLEKEGKEIPLSKRKNKLIKILALSHGKVVSNEQLCIEIWGDSGHDASLRSLLSRFKKSIGEEIITNANGFGYMVS